MSQSRDVQDLVCGPLVVPSFLRNYWYFFWHFWTFLCFFLFNLSFCFAFLFGIFFICLQTSTLCKQSTMKPPVHVDNSTGDTHTAVYDVSTDCVHSDSDSSLTLTVGAVSASCRSSEVSSCSKELRQNSTTYRQPHTTHSTHKHTQRPCTVLSSECNLKIPSFLMRTWKMSP